MSNPRAATSDKNKGKCDLCGCDADLEKHHLVPQQVSRHKNKYLKTCESNYLWICSECHDQLHALFTNQELRDLYNTKELILASDKFSKFVAWRAKHPSFKGSSKLSNNKRAKTIR